MNVGDIIIVHWGPETIYHGAVRRPYKIEYIDGPCKCPDPCTDIEIGDPPESETHYHLALSRFDALRYSAQESSGGYGLAGFRLDGSSVWNGDRIEIIEKAEQPELFPGAMA